MAVKKRKIKTRESPPAIDHKPSSDKDTLEVLFHDLNVGEIVLRVSQFGPELQATQFQALIRFDNKNTPWATGVADNPADALKVAINEALDNPENRHRKEWYPLNVADLWERTKHTAETAEIERIRAGRTKRPKTKPKRLKRKS